MKKFVCAILAMVMLLAITANAYALTIDFTIPTTCQAIADDQLYKYRGDDGVRKNGPSNTVYMRHRVAQINAGETNRIAAYSFTTEKTMGAHWHPSDFGQYPCTSNAIKQYHIYNAAGRGNTNYATKYGLNNITLTGKCYTDLD